MNFLNYIRDLPRTIETIVPLLPCPTPLSELQFAKNFWINVAILIGACIFLLLLYFLVRNQRSTLDVIATEIQRQKAKLEKEYAAIAENFVSTFQSLDNRCRSQNLVLTVINCIVFTGFLLTTFFFYKMNQPVQQWLSILWDKL